MITSNHEPQPLNFVITGEIRSGTTLVSTSINSRAGATCHADLLHRDDAVRKMAHINYFGNSQTEADLPAWFVDNDTVVNQYIDYVLGQAIYGESAVGVRVLYDRVRRLELCELFAEKYREGDFCLVHVIRNPVACFTSYQQALQSKVWTKKISDKTTTYPVPVSLDLDELVAFCRNYKATYQRIKAACPDCFEISYRDLCVHYDQIMHEIFAFIELPYSAGAAVPGCRRLPNYQMRNRIFNFQTLLRTAPREIRDYLEAEDLF